LIHDKWQAAHEFPCEQTIGIGRILLYDQNKAEKIAAETLYTVIQRQIRRFRLICGASREIVVSSRPAGLKTKTGPPVRFIGSLIV